MRKSEIDDLLSTMLESHDNVSDLNVTVDRPLQVEASGELVSVPVDPTIDNLTPFQTEIFALNIINGDRRLRAPHRDRIVRHVVLPAGQGPLPRQHLLAAQQHVDRAQKARDEHPDHREPQAAGRLQEDAVREERADPDHRRHRLG
jgi:hypothetical protein